MAEADSKRNPSGLTEHKKSSISFIERNGTFRVKRIGDRREILPDFYHFLLSLKWSRFLLLFFLFYVAVNLVFAIGYTLLGPGALVGVDENLREGGLASQFLNAFFFSVQTFATIGYGRITPNGLGANLLVTAEALFGMMAVAVSTGLVFSRISRPTSRVLFSDQAVITPVDGVPCLLFRLANDRLNQIVDAQVKVVMTKNEVTLEGQRYRNLFDLKLERDHSSIFALTWLVVHEIDEGSPLHGYTTERLLEEEVVIMVTMSGTDDTYSQNVYARWVYLPENIIVGSHFKDMLSRLEDGSIGIDISALSDLNEEVAASV